jgi:hypothetical protein
MHIQTLLAKADGANVTTLRKPVWRRGLTMTSDDDADKWARKFIKEADDFVAGKRKNYPMELGKPLYVDPKRWPRKIRNGSKVSSLKEPKDSKVSPLPTKEQREYQREIDREIESNWTHLFVLYSINRREFTPAEYWKQMALALAERHVPSFGATDKPPKQKRPRPGAPLKRSLRADANLVMHIRNLQADLKAKGLPCSVLKAAEASLKLKSPRWQTAKGWMKPKSIESEFLAANRRLTAEYKKGEMSLDALAARIPKP